VNVDLVVRVDRLPTPGETVTGGTFERHHGGKGGNQAVAASRLGRPTHFIGVVGDDAFGADARAALVAERVDVSGLLVVPGQPTGVALIMVDAQAENLIAVASGANHALTPEMVRDALMHLGDLADDVVLVSHEIPTLAVREALRTARTRGATTVFNPAPAVGLDRSTFGLADILTPNRTELATLSAAERIREGRPPTPGDDTARLAARLLEASAEGPGIRHAVIVTLGSAGALLLERSSVRSPIRTIDLPSRRVEAIDSTGAGDAFNGALAAALAEGRPVLDAASRAVAAGALATTKVGAREALPDTSQVEGLLATV
jgi:ribokinase